jgi:hypothetical protein
VIRAAVHWGEPTCATENDAVKTSTAGTANRIGNRRML